MQITNSTTTQSSDNTTQSITGSAGTLANKEVFLQMLVAQIKNQDPLNPTDGAQFMTQLAQFSQLEQLIGIRQDLSALSSTNASTTTTDQTGSQKPAVTSQTTNAI